MAINDVYALQLHQTFSGQQMMNTFYFRMKTATDPTTAALQTLASDLKDTMRTVQDNGLTYTSWLAQQVRGGTVSYTAKPCLRDGGRRVEGLYTGNVVGAGLGEGLPPQCSWVMTIATDFSGRSRRGRVYVGGISEAMQADGTFNGPDLTTYQALWTAQQAQYRQGGTDVDFEMGVWSMTIATGCKVATTPPYKMAPSGVGPDPTAAFTAMSSLTVRPIVYSQRRRTIGVGR